MKTRVTKREEKRNSGRNVASRLGRKEWTHDYGTQTLTCGGHHDRNLH